MKRESILGVVIGLTVGVLFAWIVSHFIYLKHFWWILLLPPIAGIVFGYGLGRKNDMKRESILGIVLGFAGGILVDMSVMYFNPWILLMFFWVPPLIGMLFGFRFAHKGILPKRNWLEILLIGITSVALAIYIPYALTMTELRWRSHNIPVLPHSWILKTETKFHLGESGPDIIRAFETNASKMDVMSFYRKELEQEGWNEWIYKGEPQGLFNRQGAHFMVGFDKRNPKKFGTKYIPDTVFSKWSGLLLASVILLYARFKIKDDFDDDNYENKRNFMT